MSTTVFVRVLYIRKCSCGYMIFQIILSVCLYLHVSAGKVPSDIGLQGILTRCPHWVRYAISLGLNIDQIQTYSKESEDLKGLLALKHWRDGRCSSDFPTTWKFLLEVISDHLGTKVADDLEKQICKERMWSW